jgi:hypothetical protein
VRQLIVDIIKKRKEKRKAGKLKDGMAILIPQPGIALEFQDRYAGKGREGGG